MNQAVTYWVFTKKTTKLDGLPMPGDYVAGPFDTREQAAQHLTPETKVWRFEDEGGQS